MPTSAARACGHDRANLYQEITDTIITELEEGRVPWGQPWGKTAATVPLGVPKNAATGRRCSGINIIMLWSAVIERGFSGQSWLTFRQALGLGGTFERARRAPPLFMPIVSFPTRSARRAEEDDDEPQWVPFLKRFTVFNRQQCETCPKISPTCRHRSLIC
jgi:antirestriction protein ArdC